VISTAAWSPLFRDLLSKPGCDSAAASALADLGLALAAVRSQDRSILVGSAIIVGDHDIGANVGSDHFPVVADLRF
jgi:hypothetical protein